MKEERLNPETARLEVITDQLDPRMIEFRKYRGEFKPGCKRKTIRLEITEYAPSAGRQKVTTKFGYYEGEPPPEYRRFFRKLLSDALGETDSCSPTVE